MKVTIKSILEKELIGKTVKIVTVKNIMETYEVEVKKSNNVTDKQFNSGNKKYRMKSTRTRICGQDTKINFYKIKEIDLFVVDEYSEYIGLSALMEDGSSHRFTDDIIIVDREEKLERILNIN
jgi:hypothetical protein